VSTLSKAIIVSNLCEQFDLAAVAAGHIVDLFFEEIRMSLESGQSVKLSSFGNFILRDKTARPGRNPKTGVEVPISARRVVTFRPGLKLKVKMQNKI